jgi:hypothetical protein
MAMPTYLMISREATTLEDIEDGMQTDEPVASISLDMRDPLDNTTHMTAQNMMMVANVPTQVASATEKSSSDGLHVHNHEQGNGEPLAYNEDSPCGLPRQGMSCRQPLVQPVPNAKKKKTTDRT